MAWRGKTNKSDIKYRIGTHPSNDLRETLNLNMNPIPAAYTIGLCQLWTFIAFGSRTYSEQLTIISEVVCPAIETYNLCYVTDVTDNYQVQCSPAKL